MELGCGADWTGWGPGGFGAVEACVEIRGDGPAFGGEVDHFAVGVGEVEFEGVGGDLGAAEVDGLVGWVSEKLVVEMAADEAVIAGRGGDAFVLEGDLEVGAEGFRPQGDGVAGGEEGEGLFVEAHEEGGAGKGVDNFRGPG